MIRTIGWITVSLGIVFGIGLYFGWFNFSGVSSGGERSGISVTVNKDKIQEDVEGLKRAGQSLLGTKTLEGYIQHIEKSRQELTILGKQTQELMIRVDKSTKIKIRDVDGSFSDLKVNDQVAVEYDASREGNTAKTVTVSNKGESATRR